MTTHKEDVLREMSFLSTKAWYLGDLEELKKWIDFSFLNTIFVSENGWVTTYYSVEESEKFQEALKKKLSEKLFDELCDYFFEVINKSKEISSDEEILDVFTKLNPAYVVFDELSKYPGVGTDYMIRRLIRLRKTTEDFAYKLEKKIKNKWPKDYIFYKGEIYFIPFGQFIKEKDIEILK